MSYPLQSLHHLIVNHICTEPVSAGIEGVERLPFIRQAMEESGAFDLQFLKAAAALRGTKALKLLVHTTQAGCGFLLCRLNTFGRTIMEQDGTAPSQQSINH